MAKTTSKRKQTRNFLQSGQLKNQIEARHKRRAFEQKKKGRDAKRNKGVLPAHQQPEEDEDVKEEKALDEVKRRKQEQEEDEDEDEELDVDYVLGAAGLGGSDAGESGDEDGEDADVSAGPTGLLRCAESGVEQLFGSTRGVLTSSLPGPAGSRR